MGNIFVSVKKTFGKKSIVIGNIHKPPKDNYNIENIRTFTAEFERVLYKLNGNNSEVLITGDYNIIFLTLKPDRHLVISLIVCYQTATIPKLLCLRG